jgi:protein SCO1/2
MVIAAASAVSRAAYGPGDPPAPVRLEPHPNAQMPMEATFRNEDGKTVQLGAYFKTGKPVILLPVYYGCKQTCTGTLNAVVTAIDPRPLQLELGKDFEIICISIDPEETVELAKEKRANYLKALGQPNLVGGWHFLTGDLSQIYQVTDRLGFYYAKDEGKDATQLYDHLAALYVLTPEGRVSTTVTGVVYTEPTVSLHDRLVFASNGSIGGTVTGILTKCGLMKYDPASGRYIHNPWMWAATVGGSLSLLTVGSILGTLWYGEYKKAKLAKRNNHPTTGTPAAGI